MSTYWICRQLRVLAFILLLPTVCGDSYGIITVHWRGRIPVFQERGTRILFYGTVWAGRVIFIRSLYHTWAVGGSIFLSDICAVD